MNQKTFIIAEVAQAHDGSLGILHSYIDAVSKTGVDAIKFQTHIAEAESSSQEQFRVNFSYVDKSRFDYWKRMELTEEQWVGIKNHCDEVKLEFISSPFSIAAVELLERLGVKRYKIASGEVNNFLMLNFIGQSGKPVILSSGMSSFHELDVAINFLKPFGNNLSVLQCTTAYPVPADKLGLNVLSELKLRYGLPVGLSDHSGTIYPSIAAVALGAVIIEVHVTFHKEMFGPDTKASLTLSQLSSLVEGIRYLEQSLNHPIEKNENEQYSEMKRMFGKSLAVNKDLSEGDLIRISDLESKKPAGAGISAADFQKVIGKRLNKSLKRYSFLTLDDIVYE